MKYLILPALLLALSGCEVNVKNPPDINVVKPPDINVVKPPDINITTEKK